MGLLSKLKNKTKTKKKSTTTKSTTKRKPFGGYCINFKGRTDTMEEVFGKNDITPSEMTKKIWEYVKKNELAGKK